MKNCNNYFSILALILFLIATNIEVNAQIDFPLSTNSKMAKADFYKGVDLWDMGDNKQAHGFFVKAAKQDPKFALAHLFSGSTANSTTAFLVGLEKAKANSTGATDFEKLMIDRAETYKTRDLDERIAIAKKMVAQFPDIATCYVNLGGHHWERREIELSRKAYLKAIKIAPDWAKGYNSLASSYLFAEPKDLAKAEANASKVVAMKPKSANAHILLGDCYRGQNKLEKAKKSYEKAIQLNSSDSEAYYKKGHANTYLGKYEDARADFREGRKYDEDKDIGFEAFTYMYEGNPQKGLSFLEGKLKTISSLGLADSKLNAAKFNILKDCATIAFHLNKKGKLSKFKDKMVAPSHANAKEVGTKEAMTSHDQNMLYWNAIAAIAKGKTDDANTYLKKLKSSREKLKNPRKLNGYYFASGLVQMKEKNYKAAIDAFKMSETNWIYNQYWMAKAYELSDNQMEAKKLYKKIASFNFNNVQNALIRNEVKGKI